MGEQVSLEARVEAYDTLHWFERLGVLLAQAPTPQEQGFYQRMRDGMLPHVHDAIALADSMTQPAD